MSTVGSHVARASVFQLFDYQWKQYMHMINLVCVFFLKQASEFVSVLTVLCCTVNAAPVLGIGTARGTNHMTSPSSKHECIR